jgi:quercetin dioxygenase-like cupin family protein
VHPSQWETFNVVSGRLGAKVGGRTAELGPGQVLGVAPGVAHTWWNAGEDELVFRCEIRPALQFESLIETMFSLASHVRFRARRGRAARPAGRVSPAT